MNPYKVRIYSPYFPFPPRSSADELIYEQARRYAAQGNDVELVFWKDSAPAVAEKLRQTSAEPFDSRIRLTLLQDDELRRIAAEDWARKAEKSGELPRDSQRRRVLHSLLSDLASAELETYPVEVDVRETLSPVDLAIYHTSLAYAWLKNQDAKVRQLETHQVVHFHQLESEHAALQAARAGFKLHERALHSQDRAKLARHEKNLSTLVSELWFASAADLKKHEQASPEGSYKHVPHEPDSKQN